MFVAHENVYRLEIYQTSSAFHPKRFKHNVQNNVVCSVLNCAGDIHNANPNNERNKVYPNKVNQYYNHNLVKQ